jgi:hypothetical protein
VSRRRKRRRREVMVKAKVLMNQLEILETNQDQITLQEEVQNITFSLKVERLNSAWTSKVVRMKKLK